LQYSDDSSKAIEEVYVDYYSVDYASGNGGPQCNGDDVVVHGDLNAGTSNSLTHHEGLNFCKHYPGTRGGSDEIVYPSQGRTELAPARPGKALIDAPFVKSDAGHPPACNNNACVDTNAATLETRQHR